MDAWHYAATPTEPRGPVPASELLALVRSGQLGPDTLVWREGQAGWRPLSEFSVELGLGPAIVPPLPPLPPAAYTAQPPNAGLSGGMIALIVAGAVLLLCIPVIGILAAIAIPAYQDYSLRAQVATVLPQAVPLKLAVAEYVQAHQACPDNGDTGFLASDSYASGLVAAATVGTFDNDRCGLELMLTTPGQSQLDGKAVWFEYSAADGSWQCSSEIEDRYLPVSCRG